MPQRQPMSLIDLLALSRISR